MSKLSLWTIVATLLVWAPQGAFSQNAGMVLGKLTAGVWAYVDANGEVVVSGSFLGVPPDASLLPDAVQARQNFDFRRHDPVLGCGAPGMPRAFTAASPMRMMSDGDDLIIKYESMDVVREVRMDGEPPPADTPRTPNGYATGRWEADVLIVETTHLDRRVVDLLGTPKSDAMMLEERYRIDEQDGETYLHVDLTMTDSGTFTEPFVWKFTFILRPEWELIEYACVERPVELTPGVVPN